MLNKTLIALSAAAVLVSSPAAFAQYTGFSTINAIQQTVYAQTRAYDAGTKMTKVRHVSGHKQAMKQGTKNKI